jgi:hypothetical protein
MPGPEEWEQACWVLKNVIFWLTKTSIIDDEYGQ